MHLSFQFLRETPRKRVLSINPCNYLSRRNTEKHREISRRRFRLPGLFRGVSPRNKNFAFAMVAEKRGICCYFFTGSVFFFFYFDCTKSTGVPEGHFCHIYTLIYLQCYLVDCDDWYQRRHLELR